MPRRISQSSYALRLITAPLTVDLVAIVSRKASRWRCDHAISRVVLFRIVLIDAARIGVHSDISGSIRPTIEGVDPNRRKVGAMHIEHLPTTRDGVIGGAY